MQNTQNYNLSNENAEYVKAEIIKILPDINFDVIVGRYYA